MRRLSVGMLMVTMVAVGAAEAPAPNKDKTPWSLLPADGQALTPPEGFLIRQFPAGQAWVATERNERSTTQMSEQLGMSDSTCYFIRQANPNLQAPKDRPERILLAAEAAMPPYYVSPSCLTASLVRKPDAK